jgi:hypothetical protein
VHRTLTIILSSAVVIAGLAMASLHGAAQAPSEKKTGNLILRGDMAYFLGPGKPKNCTLNNVYKRADPVGWRIEAVDPETGQHVEPEAQLVVHLNYGGKTQDIPMRWRANATNPTYQFWVAKWIVPADAPTGIVRFTVTARDKYGRTGEYKPFDVEASQLTIVDDTPATK